MASSKQPTLLRAAASPEGASATVAHGSPSGLRVLQIAFACHPHESMETRIGWQRAVHAARRHDVTVLHGAPEHAAELATEAAALGLSDRLRFIAVERCTLSSLFNRTAATYYLGLRYWHLCALKIARELHARSPIELVHQTTFCGFREPGYGWKLGVPFVWGPVGGTQAFPAAYLSQLGLRDAWIELCRNVINACQLRFSPRVRRAKRNAAVLVAATAKAAHDIGRTSGRDVPIQLETALDIPVGPPRAPRSSQEPFRILWSGRLRAWKTLPLLLKALPMLPPDVDWRLDVLGVGQSESSWKRIADRLGVADRVTWHGWPDYRQTLPFYERADAFAFTSMRDTSGTGLLEALAAGTPLVGVDHQGAADIMTPECSMPVPVGLPRDTIRSFATQLTTLARDAELWQRLSDGARAEAGRHDWESQAQTLLDWYAEAARPAARRAVAATPSITPPPAPAFPSSANHSPAAG